MGEEWRRGWHPEKIAPKQSECTVLVVGAGPSGLECARALGQRGYAITLAERGTTPGGRVSQEAALPGLAAWSRVLDYRWQQLQQMANVDVYFESELDAEQVLSFDFDHVAVATGSTWQNNGLGRNHTRPISVSSRAQLLTPDALMAGERPKAERVVIYDDDHYYMASVLAELLVLEKFHVTYVTPSPEAATWTRNTLEQAAIQTRLLRLGVEIQTNRLLSEVGGDEVEVACLYTDRREVIGCEATVLVTSRSPNDSLMKALVERQDDWAKAGIKSVTSIGDAFAPATIAHAVYAGHRYAREFDETIDTDATPFKRELTALQ